MSRLISYSQNREDIFIYSFFADLKKGTYVDVGANHPEDSSVTQFFYDLGWTGLNIEPISRLHEMFVERRPKDINLNIAIGDKPGTLVLREYIDGDGLSTLSPEMKSDYETGINSAATKYVDVKVQVKTLESVLRDNKIKDIQFLKVDVEGFEYEVLAGNDWDLYRPEVICIESNHMVRDWVQILSKANYEKVFHDGLNDYYLRAESNKRLDKFRANYISNVLTLGVIEYPIKREYEISENKRRELEGSLSKLQTHAEHLQWIIDQPKSLKQSLRLLAVALNRTTLRLIDKLKPGNIKQLNSGIVLAADADDLHSQINQYDILNEKLNSGGFTIKALPHRFVLGIYHIVVKIVKSIFRRLS